MSACMHGYMFIWLKTQANIEYQNELYNTQIVQFKHALNKGSTFSWLT